MYSSKNHTYDWVLKDGYKCKISFSHHFDTIINKYCGSKVIEGATLRDNGIVYAMSPIMRYCFEEKVNLKSKKFLVKALDEILEPSCDIDERFIGNLKFWFGLPLSTNTKVGSIDGKLIIYTTGPYCLGRKISFYPEDVPRLVEGIIKIFSWESCLGGRTKLVKTLQYYHECLKNGDFK